MERKSPTLKRPRRKLCYITENKCLANRWGEAFTCVDVDKMFDDIDVCAPETQPPSVLSQSSGSGTNYSNGTISPVPQERNTAEEFPKSRIALQSEGPKRRVQLPQVNSPILKLDLDLGIPFKAHGPIKTSSPIEHKESEKPAEKKTDEEEREHHVTPILFTSEDEAEEPQADPATTQKPLCNKQFPEEGDDCELESPPSRVTLTRVSSHKPTAEIPTKDEKVIKSVQEVRIEPEVASDKRKSKLVSTQPPEELTSRVGKDMTSFFKKLQLARASKPSCSQKSPVNVQPPPPPPEPEDDFLILEDDSPLWFSIPTKNTLSKRQRERKNSSTEKESSTGKGTKEGPIEVPQKQKEAGIFVSKLGEQTVNQRMAKKKKDKEKNLEVVDSGNNKEDLLSHRDPPAHDPIEQEKPNKKKQRKKVSSEQSEEPEDEPKGKTNAEPEKEEPAQETPAKKQKATKRKDSKGEKNSLKEKRKQMTVAVMETEQGDVFGEKSQENVPEAADLRDFTDKHKWAKVDGEPNQDKKSATATSSSSDDAPLVGKRKKRLPGEWWVSGSQSSKKTESHQPIKKSKQNGKEPSEAEPPTITSKKGKVNSKRKPKDPIKLSRDRTNEAEESKRKKRNAGNEKIKEAAAKLLTAEADSEEQEIPDQDLGGTPFQKVYHNTSHEKKLATSDASVSQTPQLKRQLSESEPRKRRTKPPGEWWTVPPVVDDLDIIATEPLQPQQPPPLKEPKKQKQQEKRPKQKPSGLGAPKNGNVASKTPGGAPVASMKPLSAPKTVKHSMATFKDIFTSAAETPAAATNRDRHQCEGRSVTSRPSEEGSDGGPVTCSRPDADAHSGADVDESPRSNQELPQDRPCQTEDMVEVLRSGPSSMIELEKFDEDDSNLPSSRVQAALSMSDFCAPPLKPFTLHPKDRECLSEFFQSFWSTETGGAADDTAVTPDHFQWYLYKDCALGIQVEITSSSICSGKLLMGSFMKKPLWVDHEATTIFTLLTSSVSVTVDGCVTRYSSGQAFMVECGRAYSIQNDSRQPAILCFTRVSAESSY